MQRTSTTTLPGLSWFRERLNSLSDQSNVSIKWVAAALLQLGENEETTSAENLRVRALLGKLFEPKQASRLETVKATDVTLERVVSLFRLRYDLVNIYRKPWGPGPEPYDVPSSLSQNLQDFYDCPYDLESEASCRVPVDLLLISAYLKIKSLYPTHFSRRPTMSTDRPLTPTSGPGYLNIYTEVDLSATILDPATRSKNVRVCGRADWTLGYSTRTSARAAGSFLIAIEAKSRVTFSTAMPQLLTYLGMLWEQRRAASKANPVVQGFYTDGNNYVFMAVNNDGQVLQSLPLAILNPTMAKTVFNWVVKMMDVAMQSTPNATPVKVTGMPGELQFEEVWERTYGEGFELPPVEIMETDEYTIVPPE